MTQTSPHTGDNILKNITGYLSTFGTWILSTLGGLGIALQNVLAVISLLQGVGLAATQVGSAFMHIIATALGGLCGGLVNFFINYDTLSNFFKRLNGEIAVKANLTTSEKLVYWLGVGVFVITGLLYGATAFAFGPLGALAVLGIVAGILVAVISTFQEMEVWLQKYDEGYKDPVETGSTQSKVIGKIITIGSVISLSLLFTMGIATFFIGIGVPIIPALAVGFGLSFTAGAFTEYVFYNNAIGDFCQNLEKKWHAFKTSRWPALGLVISVANGIVNGALAYIGMGLLIGLLVSAGVAVPPVGVIIASSIVVAIFAAIASTILGINFWRNNIEVVAKLFGMAPLPSDNPDKPDSAEKATSTHTINVNLDASATNKPPEHPNNPNSTTPTPSVAPGKHEVPNTKHFATKFHHLPLVGSDLTKPLNIRALSA